MRAFNRYLLTLTLLLLLTTVALAATGEDRLGLYYSLYIIECLVVTLFFAHLNPVARRGLNVICFGLFLGFGLVVLDRVLEILFGGGVL